MVMSDAGATAAAARQTVERPLTLSPGEVVEMGGGGGLEESWLLGPGIRVDFCATRVAMTTTLDHGPEQGPYTVSVGTSRVIVEASGTWTGTRL